MQWAIACAVDAATVASLNGDLKRACHHAGVTAVADSPGLFEDLPPRRRTPLALRWVLLALVVHLALLTLPKTWWQDTPAAPEERSVTVRLEASAPVPQVEPLPEPAPPVGAVPEVPLPTESVAEPLKPTESAPETAPTKEPEPVAPVESPARPAPAIEVERLLEAVAAMDWSTPDAALAPSRDTTSDVLERLRTPVLSGWGNRFDGMHAPSETEIVDRWLGPDGTHSVVIRAPDGETYCGRQGPVDDMRPWLQMPMLFHKCAGGGKRDAGASWRNN